MIMVMVVMVMMLMAMVMMVTIVNHILPPLVLLLVPPIHRPSYSSPLIIIIRQAASARAPLAVGPTSGASGNVF